jgi:hypothetical protein
MKEKELFCVALIWQHAKIGERDGPFFPSFVGRQLHFAWVWPRETFLYKCGRCQAFNLVSIWPSNN